MSDETTNEAVEPALEAAPVEPALEAAPIEPALEAAPVEPALEAAAVSPAPTEVETGRVNPRKVREGIVVSNKMDATVVVAVNERVSHPRSGKTVQRTKKLCVHDEKSEAKIGDRVRVQETRPLSKLKRWRLTGIVERAR